MYKCCKLLKPCHLRRLMYHTHQRSINLTQGGISLYVCQRAIPPLSECICILTPLRPYYLMQSYRMPRVPSLKFWYRMISPSGTDA